MIFNEFFVILFLFSNLRVAIVQIVGHEASFTEFLWIKIGKLESESRTDDKKWEINDDLHFQFYN